VSSLSRCRPIAIFFAIMLSSSIGGSACVDRIYERCVLASLSRLSRRYDLCQRERIAHERRNLRLEMTRFPSTRTAARARNAGSFS
jgi:hypothetical protein